MTYEFARDVLRADGDQRWWGSRFGDPHDWPRAVVGVLSESGLPALRRDGRGLHDWLAGTRMIRGASRPNGRCGWERWS